MKKIVKVSFDEGSSRIWNGGSLTGTTVMYAAKGDDSFGMQCDYDLQTLLESDPREVRAFRESRRRAGTKLRPLAEHKIHDELVVIFGPEMSAKDAVRTLRHLIEKIEDKGLLTGRNEADDYVIEKVDGRNARS
jgi:hypothetical protein